MHPFGVHCICEHPCATKLMEWMTEWCVSPSLRRRSLYPEKSLTIVMSGRIQALMMTSNVSVEWLATGARQVSPVPARHQQTPALSRATGHNYTFTCWSSYHLFPQLSHILPWQPPLRKAVNNSKWSSTLPCIRTVISQCQFAGQHGVLHDIGGSENGTLLGTRAQIVTESQPKQ